MEIEASDHTFYLTQSQHTDTRPASPSVDPVTSGSWQGSHVSTTVFVTGMTRPGKRSTAKLGIEPRSAALEADALPQGQRGGSELKHKHVSLQQNKLTQ